MRIRSLYATITINTAALIAAIRDFIAKATEFETSTMSMRPTPAESPSPAPLPDGWPPHYDRCCNADGRFVILVKCAATGRVARTSLPAWHTEEDARADAWERHADDPLPELAYNEDGTLAD